MLKLKYFPFPSYPFPLSATPTFQNHLQNRLSESRSSLFLDPPEYCAWSGLSSMWVTVVTRRHIYSVKKKVWQTRVIWCYDEQENKNYYHNESYSYKVNLITMWILQRESVCINPAQYNPLRFYAKLQQIIYWVQNYCVRSILCCRVSQHQTISVIKWWKDLFIYGRWKIYLPNMQIR